LTKPALKNIQQLIGDVVIRYLTISTGKRQQCDHIWTCEFDWRITFGDYVWLPQ